MKPTASGLLSIADPEEKSEPRAVEEFDPVQVEHDVARAGERQRELLAQRGRTGGVDAIALDLDHEHVALVRDACR
jgi:hypothetical protein